MEITLNINFPPAILRLADALTLSMMQGATAEKQQPKAAAQPPEEPKQPEEAVPVEFAAKMSPEAAEAVAAVEPESVTVYNALEAVDRTRDRIEPSDWRENTQSEGYLKYHKKLSAIMKEQAYRIGQCKPSELKGDDIRLFCEWCDNIYLDNDGDICTIPF